MTLLRVRNLKPVKYELLSDLVFLTNIDEIALVTLMQLFFCKKGF